jgi:hypothetical protein
MNLFYHQIRSFILNLSRDSRIPDFDKKIIISLLIIIIIPIDFIFKWNSGVGGFINFFALAFLFEYFFETLDHQIILSHYPWGMKSFTRFQRLAHFFAFFVPNFIKNNLWKYEREIF